MITRRSCITDAPACESNAGAFAVIIRRVKTALTVFLMLLIMLSTLASGSAVEAFAADDSYTTENFDVSVEITEKHVMKYDESITVDFLEPHHGIYRYIPIQKKFYDIDDIHVWGGDYDESYEFTGENENGTYGNEILQIGDAYRTYTGLKDYRIKYSLVCTKDEDEKKDYLSLDLLPTGWQTPIKSADIVMTLPAGIDWDDLSIYAGDIGEKTELSEDREHFDVTYSKDGKTLRIRGRDLTQGHGITVQAELPEGYWKGVTSRKVLGIFAWIVPLLLALLMGIMWLLNGKDPDVVKPVEFYPPDGLTPAEVGYIVDGKIDNKDLSSMLIYFASKGYLEIREKDKAKDSYELVKKKDIPDSEPAFAVRLFGGIFPYAQAVEGEEQKADLDDLPAGFADAVDCARTELKNMYDSGKKKMFTEKSKSARGLGVAICALILPVSVLVTAYSNYMGLGIFGAGFPLILTLIGLALISSSYDNRHSSGRVSSVGKFIAGVVLAALAALVNLGLVIVSGGSILIAVTAAASLAIALFFEVFMWARTKENAAVYGKILGFRNFIATAEHQRLVALSDENPEYYYDIMPYAMVMGMSVAWAKKFEDLKVPQPDWYEGTDVVIVRSPVFYNNMAGSCSSQFVTAMPDLSDALDTGGFFTGGDFSGGGFGGGGFSGGGFGGGGGGAW